jgi:hypothetical protein
MITTFHGWFLNLLSRAPLTRRAPTNLIEDVALLKGEAWQTWTESLRATDKAQSAEALAGLMADLPMDSVRVLLFGLLEKRAEMLARLLTQHECRHSRVPQGFPSVTGGNLDELENGIPVFAGMTDKSRFHGSHP